MGWRLCQPPRTAVHYILCSHIPRIKNRLAFTTSAHRANSIAGFIKGISTIHTVAFKPWVEYVNARVEELQLEPGLK